eukprot:TRINITY_DN66286_c4_g1_i6.p1 TRINITY_DN66286_c4_g1~~TRINITY_DN66286_c4_g1_i6.p1  ORF type:complete len:159 (-),score=84.97 TRINITY_DN66286_c4_g1_i6:90-566(-)
MDTKYWDSYYKTGSVPDEPSSFAKFVWDEKHVTKDDKVLELGSGNGRDAIFFARMGVDMTACDLSAAAVERAAAKVKDQDHKPTFFQADFCALEEDSKNDYDVIYSRFTLHSVSVKQQTSLFKWVQATLKKGGKFVIEARSVKDPMCGVGPPGPDPDS